MKKIHALLVVGSGFEFDDRQEEQLLEPITGMREGFPQVK
jgi:hypothetical protein